ncbi:uncharacterized protein PHACADRAFT_249276 [Phanerochaete carnosa HHB-10118-sp]|uniref:Anaphase-promoting complex subunit 4 WD40 domain-containing protein n=1 Tax=Phanerochaete carnosa (strain HHB-10118-sp) TaxID=650164 RepID=K5W594_PHACS|nr:uncharacterized protein PHACADRAFT_249276 [Phanerochaete carnosa HHB-10118-sp]EKM59083.1 hypothetical protein PHACADRAFT_249276 [Phanerochaete carnosa HHB-10118-sp]
MVTYAPNGALIATHPVKGKYVKVWNATTGECLHTFSFDEEIFEFAISADSSRLCAQKRKSCLIYDLHTYTHIATLQHHVGTEIFWSVSHQGDRLVTTAGSGSNEIKIWSAVTGEDLLTIKHSENLSYVATFSPDGAEVLVNCSLDGATPTYDSRTGQPRRAYNLPERANRAAYSPNGDCLVLRPYFEPLEAYDTKSAAFLAQLEVGGDQDAVMEIRFLSDSQTLVTQLDSGPLLLYNIQDILRLR